MCAYHLICLRLRLRLHDASDLPPASVVVQGHDASQQPKTYLHPPIPATRLFFVTLCVSVCSSTWGNPEVGGGDNFGGFIAFVEVALSPVRLLELLHVVREQLEDAVLHEEPGANDLCCILLFSLLNLCDCICIACCALFIYCVVFCRFVLFILLGAWCQGCGSGSASGRRPSGSAPPSRRAT